MMRKYVTGAWRTFDVILPIRLFPSSYNHKNTGILLTYTGHTRTLVLQGYYEVVADSGQTPTD